MDCNINSCLNCVDGKCDEIVPTLVRDMKPNDKECIFYSDDFKKDIVELKSKGGIMNLILKRKLNG